MALPGVSSGVDSEGEPVLRGAAGCRKLGPLARCPSAQHASSLFLESEKAGPPAQALPRLERSL